MNVYELQLAVGRSLGGFNFQVQQRARVRESLSVRCSSTTDASVSPFRDFNPNSFWKKKRKSDSISSRKQAPILL